MVKCGMTSAEHAHIDPRHQAIEERIHAALPNAVVQFFTYGFEVGVVNGATRKAIIGDHSQGFDIKSDADIDELIEAGRALFA